MPVIQKTSLPAFIICVWAAAVVIPPSSSQSTLYCTFDHLSLCDWVNVEERWKVTEGSKDGSYGPATDHEPGHGLGYYAIATGKVGKLDNKSNILRSPKINIASSGLCLKFWYYLTGPGQLNLTLSLINPLSKQVLWSRMGPGEPEWTLDQVEVTKFVGEAIFRFEGSPTLANLVNVAVDDISMTEGMCPKRHSCDFENGFCGFDQSNTDNFEWTLHRATGDSNIGPAGSRLDYNYGVNNQYSAWIDSSMLNNHTEIKAATLSLPPLTLNSTACLHFWHSIVGTADLSILHFHKVEMHLDNVIWTKSGKEANDSDWELAQIQLKAYPGSILSFQALFGANVGGEDSGEKNGQISVDNVEVKTGMCPDINNCDFEDSFCPWQNYITSGGSYWIRAAAGRTSSGASVRVDHTLGTATGNYLLLKGGSSVSEKEATARLLSPELKAEAFYCLLFWYLIDGNGILNVRYMYNGTGILTDPIYFVNGPHRSAWKRFSITLSAVNRIAIEGVIDQPRSKEINDILIDDLSIKAGECDSGYKCAKVGLILPPAKVCDFHNDCPDGEEEKSCGYSCDFDNDVCKWKGAASKGVHWSIIKSENYGDYFDVQKNFTFNQIEGGFTYALDDSGLFSRVQTNLTSPLLRRSAETCKLAFYVRSHYFQSTWSIYVYKLVGDLAMFHYYTTQLLSKLWRRIEVHVGFTDVPFQMEITTRRNSQWTSGIDIDDINFVNCDFPHYVKTTRGFESFQCQNGGYINVSRRCNFVDDCGDKSDEAETLCSTFLRCDFENDTCGWRQERRSDDFNWTRQSVDLEKAQHTGPGFDHSTGQPTGHVMQMISGTRLAGDKAWLVSPEMRATEHCWFSFYLFLYGAHVAQFTAYKRTALGGPLEQLISRNGSHGQYWIFNTVRISSPVDFQIVLEGIKGYYTSADIAIDDTSFSSKCKLSPQPLKEAYQLPMAPSPNPCNDSNMWQCNDGTRCIPKFQICDFVPQCSDQSDEKDCGTCDFESGTCGWTDISRGGFVWDLVNTTKIKGFKKPDIDHTHGGRKLGWYMLARDIGIGFTRISFLSSPVYGHSSPTCAIIFHHISTGWGRMELFLFPATTKSHEYANDGTLLWRSSNSYDRPKGWTRKAVNIGSNAAGYRLVFAYKKLLHLPAGTFALDDISFSTSCKLEKEAEKCLDSEFLCHSTSKCKPLHARCDFAKDCPDGEDEDNCDESRMIDFQYNKGIFLNDPKDDFNWDRWSGSMRSKEGVPNHDHTQGSYKGRYLYMNSEDIGTGEETGRIRSFVLYPNIHGDCFMRFFYQTKLNPFAAMSVYTVTASKGEKSVLWIAETKELREWKKVVLQLKSQTPFRVVIEGVRKRGYRGGFAVDDVTFSPHCFFIGKFLHSSPPSSKPLTGPCQEGVEMVCNESCIPVEFMCDFKSQCIDSTDEATCPSTCDFEDGMCGWINQDVPYYKPFERIAFSNISQTNDPDFQSGGYALYAKNVKRGYDSSTISTIISPLFRRASNKCHVSFLYYYSNTVEAVTLILRTNDFDEPLAYVNGRKDLKNSRQTWIEFSKVLPNCLRDFRIAISIQLVRDNDMMFALIDNITFNGCHATKPPPKCQIGEFQCANGYCVKFDQLCDLENDCCDGSDEKPELCSLYEKFTFEYGMAGWVNEIGTKFFWSVHTGWAGEHYYDGTPPQDHTKSSVTGRFLSTTLRQGQGRKASMLYEMPAPVGVCKVSFWYEINCRNLTSCAINVLLKPVHDSQKVIKRFTSSSTEMMWEKGNFKIEVSKSYKILFEGVLDSDDSSTLNIDNIVFSPGCKESLNESSLMTASILPMSPRQFPYFTFPDLSHSVTNASHNNTSVETTPSEIHGENESDLTSRSGLSKYSVHTVNHSNTVTHVAVTISSHSNLRGNVSTKLSPGNQSETGRGRTSSKNDTWRHVGIGVALAVLVIFGVVIIIIYFIFWRGQQGRDLTVCCKKAFVSADTSGIYNPSYFYDSKQGEGELI